MLFPFQAGMFKLIKKCSEIQRVTDVFGQKFERKPSGAVTGRRCFGVVLLGSLLIVGLGACQPNIPGTRVQGESVDMSSVEQRHEAALDPAGAMAANGLDLSYATDLFFGAIVIHPQRILESDVIEREDLRMLLEEQGGQLGSPLVKSERVTFYLPMTSGQSDTAPVVILELAEAISLEETIKQLDEEFQQEVVGEQTLFVSKKLKLAATSLSETKIMAGDPGLVREFSKGVPVRRGRLAELMADLDLDADVVGVFNGTAMQTMAASMPGMGANADSTPSEAHLLVDLSKEQFARFRFNAASPEEAAKIKTQIQSSMTMFKMMGPALIQSATKDIPSTEQRQIVAFVRDLIGGVLIDVDGPQLMLVLNRPRQMKEAFSAMAKTANLSRTWDERERKLEAVSAAILAYYEREGRYPFEELTNNQESEKTAGEPAEEGTSTDSATQGLSWRVRILPDLGHQELYDQFHLDEPWDSEHNLQLVEQIPEEYRLDEGDQVFSNWFRPELLSNRTEDASEANSSELDQAEQLSPAFPSVRTDVKDEPRLTMLLVESPVDETFQWTEPETDRLPLVIGAEDASELFDGLGRKEERFVMASFFDGNTHRLSKKLTDKIWQALFTFQGGEVIDERKVFGSEGGQGSPFGNMDFGF